MFFDPKDEWYFWFMEWKRKSLCQRQENESKKGGKRKQSRKLVLNYLHTHTHTACAQLKRWPASQGASVVTVIIEHINTHTELLQHQFLTHQKIHTHTYNERKSYKTIQA